MCAICRSHLQLRFNFYNYIEHQFKNNAHIYIAPVESFDA